MDVRIRGSHLAIVIFLLFPGQSRQIVSRTDRRGSGWSLDFLPMYVCVTACRWRSEGTSIDAAQAPNPLLAPSVTARLLLKGNTYKGKEETRPVVRHFRECSRASESMGPVQNCGQPYGDPGIFGPLNKLQSRASSFAPQIGSHCKIYLIPSGNPGQNDGPLGVFLFRQVCLSLSIRCSAPLEGREMGVNGAQSALDA